MINELNACLWSIFGHVTKCVRFDVNYVKAMLRYSFTCCLVTWASDLFVGYGENVTNK